MYFSAKQIILYLTLLMVPGSIIAPFSEPFPEPFPEPLWLFSSLATLNSCIGIASYNLKDIFTKLLFIKAVSPPVSSLLMSTFTSTHSLLTLTISNSSFFEIWYNILELVEAFSLTFKALHLLVITNLPTADTNAIASLPLFKYPLLI